MLRAARLLLGASLIAPPLFAQTVRPASMAAADPRTPSVADFLSPASPLSLIAAKKADRIAWMAYEKGWRNVYVAAAPTFKPVRLTNWM
jgi:dipeptidyl-peptidase-4